MYIIEHTDMVIAYGITLVLLALYSFALLDPNLTVINTDLWTQFRNMMVQFGYYHRTESTFAYLVLMGALTYFHIYFLRNSKKFSAMRLAFITATLLLFSYPFLSHDLFNYMFDAKILTYYHQNPYLHRATDFVDAHELRFMHWTHRTYPYGPTFLPITLLPSFIGFGKFSVSFILFKVFFATFYLFGVRALNRMNSQWAMFFATQPLIIVDGLINNHNDLIATSLGLMGVQLLWSKKELLGRIFFLLSGGIKYITLPLLIIQKNQKSIYTKMSFGSMLILLLYLCIFQEVQSWYFLSLFAFIPYIFEFVRRLQLFFFGLLLSYYPFILYGTWGDVQNVSLKHGVIALFAMINLAVLIMQRKFVMRNLQLMNNK